jgi:hypothetical protein
LSAQHSDHSYRLSALLHSYGFWPGYYIEKEKQLKFKNKKLEKILELFIYSFAITSIKKGGVRWYQRIEM